VADPNTNFDPAFGSAAEKLRAAAAAKGITTHYISGVRSLEDQKELYANYQAGQRGQPLPFPARGRVPLAAVPGTSMHERGLAADIEADDPSQEAALRAMAPQFGLRTIGPSDPNHFEMARNNIPQGGGAPGTFAYGSGAAPVDAPATAFAEPSPAASSPAVAAINHSAPPVGKASAPMSHEQFIRDYAAKVGVNPDVAVGVARAEGLNAWSPSNPNAGSYVDRSGGQPFSFGDFQLNVRNGLGTQALKAGIDPRDPNQWQAADQYAIDQMKAGGLGPWKGDKFAANYKGPVLGTSLATTPPGVVDPSIVARGGTSPPLPDASGGTAVAAATPAPADTGNALQRLLTKPPPTKDAQGNTVEGKSPLQKIAGAVGDVAQKEAPAAPTPQPIIPAQDPDPGLAPASSQLFQTVQQAAMRPLTWSSRPYGWNAGQQLGTTLNATGYGNG
jgi:D-alanyl-D-alanine carboxypeptidase